MEVEMYMTNFNIVRFGGLKDLKVQTKFGMWFPYTKNVIVDYKTITLHYKN